VDVEEIQPGDLHFVVDSDLVLGNYLETVQEHDLYILDNQPDRLGMQFVLLRKYADQEFGHM
jgi:hypothetical protein